MKRFFQLPNIAWGPLTNFRPLTLPLIENFSYDLFVTFSKWGFASKFSEVILGILVASSDTTKTQ